MTNLILQKVDAIRTYLNTIWQEREAEVEGLITALVARQHVLMIGPPGTGKTFVTLALSKLIDGFSYFSWLMTKFTTPEELFGPYDLMKLQQGAYERITAGKLPTANVAYLDELWKANSAILNSLLTLINERLFYNGTRIETCPLATLIGSSNEYPQEELQAAFDRFMLRFETRYIRDDANFAQMLFGNTMTPPAPLQFNELEVLQKAVETVVMDQSVVDALIAIKRDLEQEGIVISDRRWFQCARGILPARLCWQGERPL